MLTVKQLMSQLSYFEPSTEVKVRDVSAGTVDDCRQMECHYVVRFGEKGSLIESVSVGNYIVLSCE